MLVQQRQQQTMQPSAAAAASWQLGHQALESEQLSVWAARGESAGQPSLLSDKPAMAA